MGCGVSSQSLSSEVQQKEAQQIDSIVEPQMEKDSADAHGTDFEALLLPEGKLPTGVRRFGLSVNYELLDGWVKQPSPCCAAAATAGALNALRHLKRDDDGAMSHLDVLQARTCTATHCNHNRIRSQVMARNQAAHAQKLQGSAERCLGASLSALDEHLQVKLSAAALTLDHKECTRKFVLGLVKEITAEQCQSGHEAECFQLLLPLITQDEEAAEEEEEEEEDAGPSGDVDSVETITVKPAPADEVMAFDFNSGSKKGKKGGKPKRNSVQEPWQWKKAVWGWLKAKAGVAKLLREKPSTGPIGSGNLLAAIKEVDREDCRHHLKGSTLMTKRGCSGVHKLGKDDSEAEVTAQWRQLTAEFCKENAVLLFHLTNHYALIYAMREWIDDDGTVVRQMLTARRGQRPKVWLDWTEARQIMLKWAGYNIMLITCTEVMSIEAC